MRVLERDRSSFPPHRFWLRAMATLLLPTTLAGQNSATTFEVASVRKIAVQGSTSLAPPAATSPDRFYRAGQLAYFVRLAYDVQAFQVVGGPEWVRTERFQIDAKAAGDVSPARMRLMLQALLADRFKLVVREEQRETRHLALMVARADGRLGNSLRPCADRHLMPEQLPVPNPALGYLVRATCSPLLELAVRGTAAMATPVIDRTGLTGTWHYQLVYARPGARMPAVDDAHGELAPFDVAIQEQLGLKLVSAHGPVPVLSIQSVQQPSEN